MILIFLLYMLLASTFTLAKAVLCFVQPIFFVGMRMVLAGTILLTYCYAFQPGSLVVHKRDRWMFLRVCVFHIFFAYVLEFWALQYISSSNTALMYSLSPFVTGLLAYCLFNERMGFKKILGLLIGCAGLLLWIVLNADMTQSIMYGTVSQAEFVLLVAVISAAYGWVLVNELVRVRGYSPPAVNGWAMLGGGIGALVTSYYLNEWSHLFNFDVCASNAPGLTVAIETFGPSMGPIALLALYTFALILIANILFYNLYGFLLTRYSTTFLSFSGFLCPLCAAFLGHVFLGEKITGIFMLSAGIIFLGLYLFYQEELSVAKKNEVTK